MSSKKKKIIIGVAVFLLLAVSGKLLSVIINGQPPQQPVSSLQVIPGDSVADGEILAKTVMIYLDGADLEQEHNSSTNSISEILNSGLNTDFHNILLYTGGCNQWNNYNIPSDKDCIYLIRDGKLNLLAEYPAQNIGDGKTLETFMRYCVANYPSQQYGLILSDHGGGPNYGVCADYRNNYDMLGMTELQNAFEAVGFGPKAKMEFIIFEACLMASAETAFCMKDYANYMAASENVSYTYGSDFSFISCLDRFNSGAQIGTEYVNCFYDKSIALTKRLTASGFSIYDVTYSCIDLSEIDKVEQAMDALFSEANNTVFLKSILSTSSLNARGVKEYADSYGDATDAVYDLIDLTDWIKNNALYQANTLMQNLVYAVDKAVVYNRASTPHMNGLSIYYPHNIKGNYFYNTFGFSDEYSKHVKMCYDNAQTATSEAHWQTLSAPTKEASVSDGLPVLSMKLSENQAKSYAKAQYYILAKYELDDYRFAEDEYVLISSGNQFTLDSDNTLRAEFDNRVPVIYNSADGSRTPFFSPLFRKTLENTEAVYSTYGGLVYTPDEEDYPGTEGPGSAEALLWTVENMRLDTAWLTLTPEEDTLRISYAEKSGNNGLPSRTMLDPYSYKEIEFYSPIRRVKYNSDNKVLPVSDWETDNNQLTTAFPIKDITVKLEYLSENIDYYAVMVVTDIYGNNYTSDIVSLE